jgi:uncharacterized protein involved in tolerance to divalent cations
MISDIAEAKNLVGCANVIAGVMSFYQWEGELNVCW